MEGKIIKIVSNDYTVQADKQYICKARGKFRYENIKPLVGDNVIFEKNYIMEIKKRKNYLIRPMVSNIDQVLIMASVKNPDLDLNLLDKLLCIIEFNSIKPIICFSKLDLLNNNELQDIIDYYRQIGYDIYINTEIEKIKKIFKNKVTVFTGQSGSGKSTLLNKLDSSFNLKTGEISLALNRGKHTTRHVELFPLFDGFVVDTPGFSSVDFNDMTNSDIRDNMLEFNDYKELCEYKDCMHVNEEKCGIKNNPKILNSRYENYLKFIRR